MKIRFSSIPKNIFLSPLSLILGLVLLLLPLLCALPMFYKNIQHISEVRDRVEFLHKKASKRQDLFKYEERLLNQISQSDPNYLETHVESLSLLETEKQKWQILSNHTQMTQSMQERLRFLEDGKNQLRFSEGEILTSELFQEVEEKQQQPVEISEENLKEILCYIEGVRIHPFFPKERSPQLIIKSFDLTKKQIGATKERTYVLKMHLIKREGTTKK